MYDAYNVDCELTALHQLSGYSDDDDDDDNSDGDDPTSAVTSSSCFCELAHIANVPSCCSMILK